MSKTQKQTIGGKKPRILRVVIWHEMRKPKFIGATRWVSVLTTKQVFLMGGRGRHPLCQVRASAFAVI